MDALNLMYMIKALRGGSGSGSGAIDTEEVTVDLNFPAGSEETDILPLTTYSGFALHPVYGVYAVDTEVPYTLTVGETYFVVWDGETYECVCQDASALMISAVVLGNGSLWGLSGNDEPFAIATTNMGEAITGSLTDTEAGGSHTVRIYQITEGTASDMVVTPSADGKVMSKVTITKPETLIPANIASGVEIAGVVGALVGEGIGTGSGLKIAYGVFSVDSENNVRQTITHGLGEKPDFVFVKISYGPNFELTTDGAIHFVSAWGMNSKFAPLGSDAGTRGVYSMHGCFADTTDGTLKYKASGGGNGISYGMDEFPDTTNFDFNAWITTPDDTTFEVGANSPYRSFFPGGTYEWIAISGMGGTYSGAEDLSF